MQIPNILSGIVSNAANFINTDIARFFLKLALFCALFYLALYCVLTFTSPLPKPLILGVRTFAYGMGDNVKTHSAEGFCGTFGKELEQELFSNFKLIKIQYHNIENEGLGKTFPRYYGLKKGLVHIECGPNSKASGNIPEGQGIAFSDPFYQTGVRLLLKQRLANDLTSNNKNLNDIKVGAVVGTTTLNVLRGVIDENHIVEYNNRDEALNDLDFSKIQAFASDSLIVINVLENGVKEEKQQRKTAYKDRGYTIYPTKSYLTTYPTEEYVMAVKAGTNFEQELIDLINKILKREEILKAKQKLDASQKIEIPNDLPRVGGPTNLFSEKLKPIVEKLKERIIEIMLGIFIEVSGIFIARRGTRRNLGKILCLLGGIILIMTLVG